METTTTTTLVVLEVYDNPTQAEIAKSILDSAGIFCVIDGDNMAAIYSTVAFPVRIMVRDVDAQEAKALLANDNY